MAGHRDLDPFTAEQLLRGERVDAVSTPLAEILSAAAGPAEPTELTGEAAALGAFRDAHSREAQRAGRLAGARTGRVRRTAVQALRLKAAVALVVAAGTGAAAAAATGVLPVFRGTPQGAPPPASQTASSIPRTSGGSHPTSGESVPPAVRTTPRPDRTPVGPTQRPTSRTPRTTPTRRPIVVPPRIFTLCYAFDGNFHQRGDNDAFDILSRYAGGPSQVRAYCERVLRQARPSRNYRYHYTPTYRTGRPTAHPSSRPTTPPTGYPAPVPTPTER